MEKASLTQALYAYFKDCAREYMIRVDNQNIAKISTDLSVIVGAYGDVNRQFTSEQAIDILKQNYENVLKYADSAVQYHKTLIALSNPQVPAGNALLLGKKIRHLENFVSLLEILVKEVTPKVP